MTRTIIVPGKWYYFRLTNLRIIKDKYGSEVYNEVLRLLVPRKEEIHDWFKFSIDGKYILLTDHNPLGYWYVMQEKRIRREIKELESELAELAYSKPQFLIDSDDEYQDQLELGWYKDELINRIKALKKELEGLK